MTKVFVRVVLTAAVVIAQIVPSQAASDTRQLGPAVTSSLPGIQIDAVTRKDVLTALARELESRYVIGKTGNKLAGLLRAKLSTNAYKNMGTAPEFARALTADLYSVAHDGHLRVDYSSTPVGPPRPPPPEVLKQMRKLNGAISPIQILDGNVGYMCVNSLPFAEAARDGIAAAFAFLRSTDALIIDNRGDGGGDPRTVALYVSYLSDGKPYVVNTVHRRADARITEFKTTDVGEQSYGSHKPVFILISPATFSGGEELAYDLQALRRAVVVGEATAGGANLPTPVLLPHQFVAGIPESTSVNPITGANWEGVGVKPDVVVPAAAALSRAHALAVERLTAAATDSEARSALNDVAIKLQFIADAMSESLTKLTESDIVGTYVGESSPGIAVTILERDGRLVQHVDGAPDRELVLLKGNYYQEQGLPAGVTTSFRSRDGKTEMLIEVPFGRTTIREKQ